MNHYIINEFGKFEGESNEGLVRIREDIVGDAFFFGVHCFIRYFAGVG